jgi:hypothetical protein
VFGGVGLTLLLAGLGVTAFGSVATADPAPSVITDYDNYPAPLPSGCPDGAGALEGLSFSNGRGGQAGDLRALDVRHGDTVTMSWTGFADGCTKPDGSPAITVSLVVYETNSALFDPWVDEPLLPGAESCGDGAGSCGSAGGHSLSITLPTSPQACNVQLDAVLGLPIAVVGPSGSYYSPVMRGGGPDMLVSAANFGLQPCEEAPPETTTTTAPPAVEETTTTTAPPAVEETTTTTAPPAVGETTTTTEAAAAPTTSSTEAPPPARVTSPAAVSPAAVSPVAVSPSNAELPFTGAAHTIDYVRLGFTLSAAGAVIAIAGGLWHRRRLSA